LPAGLSLDNSTCEITGTPTELSAWSTYTVTLTTASETKTSTLNLYVSHPVTNNSQILTGGGGFGCYVKNGGLQCWGRSTGNGDPTSTSQPHAITVFSAGSGVTAASSGGYHSCAVINGGIKCWGTETGGAMGNATIGYAGSTTPVSVQGLPSGLTVKWITSGYYHVCALLSDESVWCWGNNAHGQLGNGDLTVTQSYTPLPVTGLGAGSGTQAISGSIYGTCALVKGGVKCWGEALELGANSGSDSATPLQVVGLSSGVVQVSGGGNGGHNVCALLASGQTQCWGQGNSYELGNGLTSNSLVPVVASNAPSALAVFAGGYFTCAYTSSGVKCWGRDDAGQLGDNNISANKSTPVSVVGLSSSVDALVGGSNFSCALTSGTVWCWGANAANVYALGNGDTSGSNYPYPSVATILSF